MGCLGGIPLPTFYAKCGVSQTCRTPKSRKSMAADLFLVDISCGDFDFSSSPVRD
jgi:hypothetical protein